MNTEQILEMIVKILPYVMIAFLYWAMYSAINGATDSLSELKRTLDKLREVPTMPFDEREENRRLESDIESLDKVLETENRGKCNLGSVLYRYAGKYNTLRDKCVTYLKDCVNEYDQYRRGEETSMEKILMLGFGMAFLNFFGVEGSLYIGLASAGVGGLLARLFPCKPLYRWTYVSIPWDYISKQYSRINNAVKEYEFWVELNERLSVVNRKLDKIRGAMSVLIVVGVWGIISNI